MELNYFQVSRKYNSVITAILAGCKWSKRQSWFTTEWVSHPGRPPQPSPAARTGFAEDWPKSKNQRWSKHLADGDKDLNPCEYWHVGIFVSNQLSRPNFWGARVSLSSTNREVWFSNALGPQHLWCDASGHAIQGARSRVKTQGSKPFCVSEGKTPLSPWPQWYLLAQTLQVQKAPCLNSHQPSPEGLGSWNAGTSWPNRERRGWASTTSTAPVPESCQTVPMLGHLSGCVQGTIFTRHFPPGWKQSSH